MNARIAIVAAACTLAAGAAGCGFGDDGGSGGGPNPNDKRAVTLACMTERQGIDAQLAGEQSIQVAGPGGPRVEFFVSSGEAEARQFEGEAQGAQQVGAALLFVNDGSERLLGQIEDCLAEQ
jgi:hypothetical protein